MKRYLVPILLVAFETPVLAAPESGFNDLQFALLLAFNLMITGLILFGCLVIAAALYEKWRIDRQSLLRLSSEQTASGQQPRASYRKRKQPAGQQSTAFSR